MGFFKSLMSVITTGSRTGIPFNLDKNHTVYCKGNGVTKAAAARAAGFFKGYGYFTDSSQSDVQLFSKEVNGPIELGFIIGGTTVSAQTENYFKGSIEGLQELFGGRKVTVKLLDTNLKQLKIL